MVTPDASDPPTVQVPAHDCRHPHDTAPAPHAFCAHSTIHCRTAAMSPADRQTAPFKPVPESHPWGMSVPTIPGPPSILSTT